MNKPKVLVIGGSGTTGSRVVDRLRGLDITARIGSRRAEPAFDWERSDTWAAAVNGMDAAYIAHQNFTAPEAHEQIEAFSKFAVANGLRRLVLLSARANSETLQFEKGVTASGAEWTIVRPSWFNQNFCEGFFRDAVLAGEIALPVGNAKEPFVDADDIADVVVASLQDDKHVGKVYELSGPVALDLAEASAELSEAVGHEIRYTPLTPQQFAASLGLPEETPDMYGDFNSGAYAHVVDGVREVLGREPKAFADFARDAAASGVWRS